MRVLVIGGTRFMGPHVVRELVTLGHAIAVFHRSQTEAELPEEVNHIHGDRNRLSEFSDEFKRFQPDVVLDMMLLNETQARELVSVMSGVAKRLVVASSCDVYRQYDLVRGVENGPATNERVNEDSPLRNRLYPYRNQVKDKENPLYDYDKILVERTVMSGPDLPATVLRLPMVHGPNDYQHRFLEFIKRMADRRPAILLDPQEARWRITRGYAENCAHAICLAITNAKAAGRIYNVGEPSALSQREWITRLDKIIDWRGKVVTLPQDRLPDHLQSDLQWQHHLDVDTTRIGTELGYEEPIEIDAALRRTIDWELANRTPRSEESSEYAAEDSALAALI